MGATRTPLWQYLMWHLLKSEEKSKLLRYVSLIFAFFIIQPSSHERYNIYVPYFEHCQSVPQMQLEETQRVMIRPPLHKFPLAGAPSVAADLEVVPANTSIDNEELEIERLLLSLKAPPVEGAWSHNQNRKWVKVSK